MIKEEEEKRNYKSSSTDFHNSYALVKVYNFTPFFQNLPPPHTHKVFAGPFSPHELLKSIAQERNSAFFPVLDETLAASHSIA